METQTRVKYCVKCKSLYPLAEFIYHTRRHESIIAHEKCYNCYKKQQDKRAKETK